jgi:hypothetical protein
MGVGISNRLKNVFDLIVLSLVCNALFTVEINVFVPFTPITDRLSNRKCTNTRQVGGTFDPSEAPFFLGYETLTLDHTFMKMDKGLLIIFIRKMEFERRNCIF